MTVSLFVPTVSVSAETNDETEATVSTYNLVALMNRGDKLLEEYDFTEDSLADYKLAYDKAMKVLFYGKTQEEIDSAKAELESAINALSAQIETTTAPAPIYRLAGDVNEDSKVNVRDATAIQKHLANIITLSSVGVALADANGDGKYDSNDIYGLIGTSSMGSTMFYASGLKYVQCSADDDPYLCMTDSDLLKATDLFTPEEIKIGIEKSVPASKTWLIEKNIEAVNIGYHYEK